MFCHEEPLNRVFAQRQLLCFFFIFGKCVSLTASECFLDSKLFESLLKFGVFLIYVFVK